MYNVYKGAGLDHRKRFVKIVKVNRRLSGCLILTWSHAAFLIESFLQSDHQIKRSCNWILSQQI